MEEQKNNNPDVYLVILHPKEKVNIRNHIDMKDAIEQLFKSKNPIVKALLMADTEETKKILFNKVIQEAQLTPNERAEVQGSYFILHVNGFLAASLEKIAETFNTEEIIDDLGVHLVKLEKTEPQDILSYLVDVDESRGIIPAINKEGQLKPGAYIKKYDINLGIPGIYISGVRIKKEFIEKFV